MLTCRITTAHYVGRNYSAILDIVVSLSAILSEAIIDIESWESGNNIEAMWIFKINHIAKSCLNKDKVQQINYTKHEQDTSTEKSGGAARPRDCRC